MEASCDSQPNLSNFRGVSKPSRGRVAVDANGQKRAVALWVVRKAVDMISIVGCRVVECRA